MHRIYQKRLQAQGDKGGKPGDRAAEKSTGRKKRVGTRVQEGKNSEREASGFFSPIKKIDGSGST